MILARQVPVRLADLLGLGLAIDPERFVVVFLYANGHCSSIKEWLAGWSG